MADETKVKLGSKVEIRVTKRPKAIQSGAKVDDRRYGPPPFLDDENPRPIKPLEIIVSDISTLYLYNNRINNGTVSEIILGRAVIATTLPRSLKGDTYGDSLVEFTTGTIAASNESILRFLDGGGG
jgi:hypothetical protein